MRYGKLTVSLFTLLFAAMAVILWAWEPRIEVAPVALTLHTEGHEETITCWENEEGVYFLFLPSYAEHASVQLQTHAREVRIDGRLVENGMSCETFLPNTPYSFAFSTRDGEENSVLVILQSENLPTLHLETGSGDMDYIHGKKGNQEAGLMRLYSKNGEQIYTGNLDAINGRGNDWLIPKKSYSLQLAAAADLLGMGQAEKWILLSNAIDASHLRNKLIYDFSQAVGLEYSPESQWVDLYLNGEYAGVYLLCERNEFHDQRISLAGEGKYLVSMDHQWRLEQNGRPFVTTQSGYAFRVHESQLDEQTLQQRLQSVESAIAAEDGRDPLTGKQWTELIDLDSWVKKYLVEEIFGNGDAGAISQYYYGSADESPMYAGPVWDYDVSMGNSQGRRGGDPQSIFAGRSRVRSNIGLSWLYEVSQKDAFYDRMVEVYREECLPLLDQFLHKKLDEYIGQIAQASVLNQLRWESIGASQVSVFDEAENIRAFMEARVAFLNQLWLEETQFYRVLIDADDGRGTICFAVPPGQQIPYLPDYDPAPEILGWYAVGAEEPFDITQPIRKDMEIVLRRLQPELPEEASEEPEDDDTKVPLKYAPFVLLLGILGIVWFVDGKKQWRKAAAENQEMLVEKGSFR